MLSKMDQDVIIQVFIVGLQPQIKTPLLLHEYTTYDDVLKKALRVESNADYSDGPIDRRLEDKIETI